MFALGDFVFSLETMLPQELNRRTDWRYARNTRQQARSAAQYLGPGDDRLSLAGDLVPTLAGDASSLNRLRTLAARGEAQPLVGGDGTVFGAFLIVGLDERRGYLQTDGTALRYDFMLDLEAVDDADALAGRVEKSYFDETVDVDDAEKDVLSEDEKALLAEGGLV
ncbi:phage tail protein [Caulobacter segnis]|nr:phage tail protein [Caulobacter segnis]